jgi:hypothetical protein
MKAWTVVGPTNFQPWFRRSFDSVIADGEVDAVSGAGPVSRIRLVLPDEGGQGPLTVDQFHSPTGVVDDGFDLASMTHDARVIEQTLDVRIVISGHGWNFETRKGGPEVCALGQDRAPAETGLETFQAQLLEKSALVGDGVAPLCVVVVKEIGSRPRPSASRRTAGADKGRGHVRRATLDGEPEAVSTKKRNRLSAITGLISMISERTIPSATNGSASNRTSRSAADVLCAKMAPPMPG